MLLIFICLPSTAPASGEDPLKEMELNSLTEENSVEDTAEFFSIGGYLESRDQVRIKEIDEPISLRQRLWLGGYNGIFRKAGLKEKIRRIT